MCQRLNNEMKLGTAVSPVYLLLFPGQRPTAATPIQLNRSTISGSLRFRGVSPNVGAGLVPAQTRATARVAPTSGVNLLNSQRTRYVCQTTRLPFLDEFTLPLIELVDGFQRRQRIHIQLFQFFQNGTGFGEEGHLLRGGEAAGGNGRCRRMGL